MIEILMGYGRLADFDGPEHALLPRMGATDAVLAGDMLYAAFELAPERTGQGLAVIEVVGRP